MTDLDSVLKSRDIILLTKVCIVKAVVFPVVMYRCESWTIKKTEGQRVDAFINCSPLDYKDIKSVNPESSLEGLMLRLKLQYFGHLIQRTGSLERTLMLGKIEGRGGEGDDRG